MLGLLEVPTIGQAMSLYSSSASWFISQLMNRGSDPANGLSAHLQNRVTVVLAQGLKNPTETSRKYGVSVYEREDKTIWVSVVRIKHTCNNGCEI